MASLSQISALAELLKPDQNELPEKENVSRLYKYFLNVYVEYP